MCETQGRDVHDMECLLRTTRFEVSRQGGRPLLSFANPSRSLR
jgi:hypothetical protein